MSLVLAENINLHVIPTKKYKTIQIMIRFATEMTREKASLRTLLSSMLETNSRHYPTSTAMSKKLSEMYGARFNVGTNKKGNVHQLNLVLSIVNPKYLPHETALLEEGLMFLNEVLFSPNIKDGQFDLATFGREKNNLQSYINSVYDDKQSHAALSLQELYFSDSEAQKTPGFGKAEDVASITSEELATYYLKMLREDTVDVMVLGDVSTEDVAEQLASFAWGERAVAENDQMYYQKPHGDVLEKKETLPVKQGKLNMGYHTGIYFHDENYFAMQVFNGLFGGFPHSKLFVNVREKESMAYYASSSLDTFRGMMTVQTGIDSQNREKVLRLIEEQRQAVIDGQVSDEVMLQTKAMLKNHYLLSQDNPNAILESEYLKLKFPQSALTDAQWLGKLESVTLEEVQQVAKNVRLQAIYFMEGNA
ncbi:EF-P 5-aminopentanol modification-associated protein YfmF [Vagococcus elongatus]|uniref:Peptidase M16 n=1 Tax=Vagococcus elongatus TaxID=180344 RepID=A0A430B1G2_9ENTE|nr:pitrilysin family protein [Vagococcus elongatus]RSU14062.1 peptidase M16 [Vagococcus elongatus]